MNASSPKRKRWPEADVTKMRELCQNKGTLAEANVAFEGMYSEDGIHRMYYK